MSLITVSSLAKSYGPTDIFSGVSFSVVKGARMAIVGPNGIGKNSLTRCAGVVPVRVRTSTAMIPTNPRTPKIKIGLILPARFIASI